MPSSEHPGPSKENKQHAIEDRDSAGGKCLLFQPNWLSPLLCKSDSKINWACKVLSLLFIHLLYLRKTVLPQCFSCLYLYTYIYIICLLIYLYCIYFCFLPVSALFLYSVADPDSERDWQGWPAGGSAFLLQPGSRGSQQPQLYSKGQSR